MRTPIAVEQMFAISGRTATGEVSFLPSSVAYFAGIEYPVVALVGDLDSFGRLVGQDGYALQLLSTDQDGLTPTDLVYIVTIRLDGESLRAFSCQLPGDSTATEYDGLTVLGSDIVQLQTLIASPSMIGQAIIGTNIPDGTTVLAISAPAFYPYSAVDSPLPGNTLQLSAQATGTQVGDCEFTVGGAVLLSSLEPVST